ncbi:hypothetical protein [Microbulbifer sp. ARAS458-1]|uniref:hypothetical protein n=1 Tax=Microbulbifer sp. ARAS458-1 TaxID=3140242 RepID=UPI0038781E5F
MKQSILQLDHYTFVDFSVKCNLAAELEDMPDAFHVDDLEFSLEQFDVAQEEGEPRRATIKLNVKSKSEDISKDSFGSFYSINIEVIGYLAFTDEAPDGYKEDPVNADKVLVFNGANILYGLMRDRLESITASMPWGRAILPLATFDGLVKTNVTQSEAEPQKAAQ